MLNTTSILDIPISRLDLPSTLAFCREQARQGRGGYVCFANVHTVTESGWNSGLREALLGATMNAADGVPLVWVSRLWGRPIASRVCGPDFITEFLTQNRDMVHGFVGGRPGQAEAIAEKFNVKGVFYAPPMRPFTSANAAEDWQKLLKLSGDRAPAVVWVGLGAPKQEQWMHAVARLAPATLFFGVGAAFDFYSGTKKRAPQWMQNLGLEWFYRLTQEPRRLWKRYLGTNSRFVLRVCLRTLFGPRK
jgi:N-acetylglucosaminyldiphosphoundecaprenol N-acetyl-beta-D-mannosaminyltransferase